MPRWGIFFCTNQYEYMGDDINGGYVPKMLIEDVPPGVAKKALISTLKAAGFTFRGFTGKFNNYDLFRDDEWPCNEVNGARVDPKFPESIPYGYVRSVTRKKGA